MAVVQCQSLRYWSRALNKVPFDKEKFCNHCCGPCNKGRVLFLEKIEYYREHDPEIVKWLEWHRDRLWDDMVRGDQFSKERHTLGDEEYNKKVAEALRAMADKIEQPGMHFIVDAEIPKLPIFSGEDHVERYASHIEVTIVAGPLGG